MNALIIKSIHVRLTVSRVMIYSDSSLDQVEGRLTGAQSYRKSFIILQDVIIHYCNGVALFSSRDSPGIKCERHKLKCNVVFGICGQKSVSFFYTDEDSEGWLSVYKLRWRNIKYSKHTH